MAARRCRAAFLRLEMVMGASGEGDTCPFCGSATVGEVGVRIVPNKERALQVRRTGERKLFGKERKEIFLQWFAATGNLGFAAEQAEVARQTISKHRLSDPAFDAAYRQAIELGVPELQARLLAHVRGRPKLDLHGELEAPDEAGFDPQLALQILREQQRIVAAGAGAPGQALKRGRRPRMATNAEVEAALTKALVAFGKRVTAGGGPPAGTGDDGGG